MIFQVFLCLKMEMMRLCGWKKSVKSTAVGFNRWHVSISNVETIHKMNVSLKVFKKREGGRGQSK